MRPPMTQGLFNCYHDIALWFTLAKNVADCIIQVYSLNGKLCQMHDCARLYTYDVLSESVCAILHYIYFISYLINVSAGYNFPRWKSDLEKDILNSTSYAPHVLLMHHWCLHYGWSDTSNGSKCSDYWALEEVMTHVKNGHHVCWCFSIEDQISSSSSSLSHKAVRHQMCNLTITRSHQSHCKRTKITATSIDTSVNWNTELDLPCLIS